MEKQSRMKKFIENLKRPFVAIFGANEDDEQNMKEELAELARAQASLKENKDYNSNIQDNNEFIQKVNIKERKHEFKNKKLEKELTEDDLGWEK